MLKQSELSFNEFLTAFKSNETGLSESGLCEVFKTDDSYTYVSHTFVDAPYTGFFIVNLSDGLAFLPVTEVYPDQGYEQIEFESIRLFDKNNEEDKFLLEEAQECYETVLSDIKTAMDILNK